VVKSLLDKGAALEAKDTDERSPVIGGIILNNLFNLFI
jgi:hypothetical protein